MKKLLSMMILAGLLCGTCQASVAQVATASEAERTPLVELAPTPEAEAEPTPEAEAQPTQEPTAEPTQEPTAEPTQEPTAEPTQEPTAEPTQEPTAEPTVEPVATPVPFTGRVRIDLIHDGGQIYFGDSVTLRAVITDANVDYTLRWECFDGEAWSVIPGETSRDYTFVVTPENATLAYRVVIVTK